MPDLTDAEREHWIHNDQGLFDWWKSTGLAVDKFIAQNHIEIDKRAKLAQRDRSLKNLLASARRY